MTKKTKILCILDGFGLTETNPNNANALAGMTNFKKILNKYPWTVLNADGEFVGQEKGLVGNSEVGHMNIGGLKLVPQLSYQVTHSSLNSLAKNLNVAPDQLYSPRFFIESKIFLNMLDLSRIDDEVAKTIYHVYLSAIDIFSAGENLSTIPQNVTVESLFEFFVTWWTYSDLSLMTLKDIINDFDSKFREDSDRFANDQELNLSRKEVFENILKAYELSNSKDENDLINYLNNLDLKSKKSEVVHLIGLFSTGTIHSDMRHWVGAIEAAGIAGSSKIVMHLISDGRDSDRQSLVESWNFFVEEYRERLSPFSDRIFLGSVGGRFYAMDRDKNWDRVAKYLHTILDFKIIDEKDNGENKQLISYFKDKYQVDLEKINNDLKSKIEGGNILDGKDEYIPENDYYSDVVDVFFDSEDKRLRDEGKSCLEVDIPAALKVVTSQSYKRGNFDEHILPVSLYYFDSLKGKESDLKPPYTINKSDIIWFVNFRTDRMKQILEMICEINNEFKLDLNILGMNSYDIDKEVYDISSVENESGYYPVFRTNPVQNPLAEYISNQGKNQLHIAETEKYNHVTFFLNGGQNKKWPNEDWVVISSNKIANHADMPEMKAVEVADYILENGIGKYDYIIVNFANPDMVGHTGDIQAGINSMQVLDQQIGRLLEVCENGLAKMVITADHGNIEFVGEYEEDGKTLTDTEHNPNPVPCILVGNDIDTKDLVSKLSMDSGIDQYVLVDFGNEISKQKKVDGEWVLSDQVRPSLFPLWMLGWILLKM